MNVKILYRQLLNKLFDRTLFIAATLVALAVLFIFAFVFKEGFPFIHQIGIIQALKAESWHPSEGLFNYLPMVFGSILCTAVAMLIATPLAYAIAIAQVFLFPQKISNFSRILTDTFAGIPSVIFGLWGLTVLVPKLAEKFPPGTSLLTAGIVLSLMIIPTIASSFTIALEERARQLRPSAIALGISQSRLALQIVTPAALGALGSGISLGIGRAAGETMAILRNFQLRFLTRSGP